MKFTQGYFRPNHPEKYIGDINDIVYRSSWELKVMRRCDTEKNIVQWSSETMVIPYWSRADNRMRRYFVDFIIKVREKSGELKTWLVEVKPKSQTMPPVHSKGKKKKTILTEEYTWMVNNDKWNAAKAFADKNGMGFMILTEDSIL